MSALQVLQQGITPGYNNSTTTAFTGSWDHSLKQWDIERQDVMSVFTSGSKITTSLDANSLLGLVATSHSDGKVRLWDTRHGNVTDNSASNCQSITNDSKNAADIPQFVSNVKWHPTSSTIFACTDYSGIVRVWDIRSAKIPLGEKETHDGKALCSVWVTNDDDNISDSLFTGGSDCAVHATSFQ